MTKLLTLQGFLFAALGVVVKEYMTKLSLKNSWLALLFIIITIAFGFSSAAFSRRAIRAARENMAWIAFWWQHCIIIGQQTQYFKYFPPIIGSETIYTEYENAKTQQAESNTLFTDCKR